MTAGPANVLLVRHGPGRGRFVNYANAWLRRAERTAPELRRRLLVHETGTAEPSLDGVGAVMFLLADPLRERYPGCFDEAQRIAGRARQRGIRIVNPPEALSNTIKTVQAELWQAAGLPCAACVPYGNRAEFEAAIARVPFPAIVRADLLHAQQFTFQCQSRDEAEALTDAQLRYPGVMLQFIDTRAGWSAVAPGSVWDRLYHRCRAFVFGDRVYPHGIYFSEGPIVAAETSTFRSYQGWGMLRAPFLHFRPKAQRALEADLEFARRPVEHAALMVRAVRALGLDFAAVDYARRADGSVVLWEANPHPALPVWRYQALPIARRLRGRWNGIYDGALEFLAGLP